MDSSNGSILTCVPLDPVNSSSSVASTHRTGLECPSATDIHCRGAVRPPFTPPIGLITPLKENKREKKSFAVWLPSKQNESICSLLRFHRWKHNQSQTCLLKKKQIYILNYKANKNYAPALQNTKKLRALLIILLWQKYTIKFSKCIKFSSVVFNFSTRGVASNSEHILKH